MARASIQKAMTTPRLPPLPDLDWKPDGTPVATAMDDVYFSVEDGLEETRAVFLAGCGLPTRWQGREHFTVAELGFGTGLNLLALWQMWQQHRPSPTARLDFVSFEGFPMERKDAARALERWPELAPLTNILLANWPVRARGVQHIPLADGVHLTLHIGEIGDALPNSQIKADAWFLDGFAPAKNNNMWADNIYPLLAERSAPGAWIGTYTVAGAVRRGLADAGFEVSKQPGFGRKRDRLQAIAPSISSPEPDPYALYPETLPPRTVAIIGAGIAGAALAHAFAARGADVTVFDKASEVASGASGNPLALLMPRLDAGDTGAARVLIASYLFARKTYSGRPGVQPVIVQQTPKDETQRARFEKLLTDPPFAADLLGPHLEGGLAHAGALILSPADLVPALIGQVRKVLGHPVEINMQTRQVNGAAFDMIILANGMGIKAWPETSWLPLSARLGQVEIGSAPERQTSAIASGHYALAHANMRLWGASFAPINTDTPVTDAAARTENNAALATLVPPGWVGDHPITSRAGIRATTPDKLPFAGRAPNFKACLQILAPLRNGVTPTTSPPVHNGIWMLGGLGARGFTFAPLLAEQLASLAYATPSPLGRTEAELVSPLRFIHRDLKRKRI